GARRRAATDREGVTMRHLIVGGLFAGVAAAYAVIAHADGGGPLRFAISFPTARSAQPLDGRLLLFISDDGKTEPRAQTDQYRANSTRPIFGVGVDGLEPGQNVIVDDKVVGWPARSLTDVPAG